jgi:hypothetical protein
METYDKLDTRKEPASDVASGDEQEGGNLEEGVTDVVEESGRRDEVQLRVMRACEEERQDVPEP